MRNSFPFLSGAPVHMGRARFAAPGMRSRVPIPSSLAGDAIQQIRSVPGVWVMGGGGR